MIFIKTSFLDVGLPRDTNVGGVGIYVKDKFEVKQIHDYKINSNDSMKVENLWLDVSHSATKYIIGGIYRHPNRSMLEFTDAIDPVLRKISSQNIPCIIAGDINIDLTKCRINNQVHNYIITVNEILLLKVAI